jgi:hypothetical protein
MHLTMEVVTITCPATAVITTVTAPTAITTIRAGSGAG